VYVTSVDGDQREKGYVLALDEKTGKEKWRHPFSPTQRAKWTSTVARAAPTPCVDADGVYAFFEGGNLIALNHSGKLRWERSLVTDYGEFKGGHGIGTSPAQTADSIFLLIDHGGPCYLVAFDKTNGAPRWKVDRAGKSSWTTPVVSKQGGKSVIVASSNGSVIAYEAGTGTEVWKLGGVIGNTLSSATVVGDAVVIGTGTGQAGAITAETKTTCCLSLTETAGKPGFQMRWSGKAGIANYASPVVADGVAYFVNPVGVLTGYDLKSGKELFAERIASTCWATPIVAGGNLFCFGKDGVTSVVKTGPDFRIVTTNKLWEAVKLPPAKSSGGEGAAANLDPVVYGVAAANDAWFVRTGTNLYRIGKP
jgi:outer membrane protein assembly factor BamB